MNRIYSCDPPVFGATEHKKHACTAMEMEITTVNSLRYVTSCADGTQFKNLQNWVCKTNTPGLAVPEDTVP